MASSYVVVLHAPGQPPQQRELSLPRAIIGREVGDIVLPDARCSSTHAEILFDGTSVRIRDLGSTNGTWCNGQRISDGPWQLQMPIQIGEHSLVLQEIRAAGPAKGRTVAGNVMMAPPQASVPNPGAYGPPPATGPNPNAFGAAPAVSQVGGYGSQAYGPPPTQPSANFGVGGQSAPQGQGQAQGQPGYAAPQHYQATPQQHQHQHQQQQQQQQQQPAKKKSSGAMWIAIPVVLLGTCVAGIGGVAYYGSKGGASGDAPAMSEAREAKVNFVWFAGEPGPNAKGGTAAARIRVGPNKTGAVSVGVAEEFAGGGGNQWRTATWLAAFNATRTVGASLADYEFNVHVGGHTDGPSAGMLTTASMIALIRNQKLREDTTMTGTINPDGTAGPVGGIVQKMEGAQASGLKRFGFPLGCRNHRDMKTGADVDLLQVAQRLGLETKEINDVYEGYEWMTGATLPRVEPVPDAEMEPGEQTQALLRAKIAGWKARIDREIGALKQEAKRTNMPGEIIGPLIADADKSYESAKRNERNGYMVAALQSFAATAARIAMATRLTNSISLFATRNFPGLLQAMQTAETVKGEIDAYGQQLEVRAQGKSKGGQISTVSAFGDYVQARAATMVGDDFLAAAAGEIKALQSGQKKATQETVNNAMLLVVMTTGYFDVARIYLDVVKETQDLIVDEGSAKPMDAATIDRTVAGYASASTAVLAYFDAIITEEVAKANKMSKEQAQLVIAEKEQDYLIARKANSLSEYTGKSGVTDGVKLMRLAAAASAYLTGNKLVNKWYSLDGHIKNGEVVLENRRALTTQLELARRNAREAAARAKASAGFIPTAARLNFQSGNALREGSDEEKLDALTAYWTSTFWSELAAFGPK